MVGSVSSAPMACSCFRLSFSPCPVICAHLPFMSTVLIATPLSGPSPRPLALSSTSARQYALSSACAISLGQKLRDLNLPPTIGIGGGK
jgi:hypothetical protein